MSSRVKYLVNIATSSTTYVSRSRICLLLSEFIWFNSSEVIADRLHTVMTIKCIKNSKTSNPNTKIFFKFCVFSQSYHDELTRQLQWLYDHWPDWLHVYTKVELVLQFFKKQNWGFVNVGFSNFKRNNSFIIHKKNFWCEKIIYDITFAGDLPYYASSVDARGTHCFTCSILWRTGLSLRLQPYQVKSAKNRKLMLYKTITLK